MKGRRRPYVTASELAQMGICERQIVLDARHGRHRADDQERRAHRGDQLHTRFHREAMAVTPDVSTSLPKKKWCFLASAVFAEDAPELRTLRSFRDVCLRPYRLGRVLIWHYYRLSPFLACFIARHSVLATVVRWPLRVLVALAWLVLRMVR